MSGVSETIGFRFRPYFLLISLLVMSGFPWPAAAVWGSGNLFENTRPIAQYEEDPGADHEYIFGVSKAFHPYQDPDRSIAARLPDPLKNPDFRSYSLIVIVTTRDDPFWGPAQTMRVYKRGQGLLYYWLISTGKRGYETSPGYFRPQLFSSRHWSTQYQVPMMWAVFFNRGMALHSSIDRESLQELGNVASSHGCVHIEDYRAEELFHLIGQSGYGSVEVIDRVSGRMTNQKVNSYRSLIIVSPASRW